MKHQNPDENCHADGPAAAHRTKTATLMRSERLTDGAAMKRSENRLTWGHAATVQAEEHPRAPPESGATHPASKARRHLGRETPVMVTMVRSLDSSFCAEAKPESQNPGSGSSPNEDDWVLRLRAG